MKKWAKNSALAIGVSVKPDVSLVALVNVSQKGFASIVNVSEKKSKKNTWKRFTWIFHENENLPVLVLNFLLYIYQVRSWNVSF